MRLTPEQYLRGEYRDWAGDWEGDFDFLEGRLVPHDWGDYDHASVMATALVLFRAPEIRDHLVAVPSLTLLISDTRFRVPDISVLPEVARLPNRSGSLHLLE